MANFNLNKVILGGRLTADPVLKQTSNGISVTSFSIAVNRRSGEEQTTDFINIVAWRKTAEFVCKYFKKGSCICVVGAMQTRSWDDANGQKRYATDVVADEIKFVDSKSENGTAGSASENGTHSQEQANFEALEENDDLPF